MFFSGDRTMSENCEAVQTEKERLEASIKQWQQERKRGQVFWSAVHHSALFGSIICSIAAGAVVQMDDQQMLASALTSIAAVLTGIASYGRFDRKWRSNRLSRSEADRMLVDMASAKPNIDAIREQYKLAIEKHDAEVVGDIDDDPRQQSGSMP